MKHSRIWVAAMALTAIAGGAHAQKAGDWVVGAGALLYAPQDSTTPLRFVSPVQQEIPGSGANVPDGQVKFPTLGHPKFPQAGPVRL